MTIAWRTIEASSGGDNQIILEEEEGTYIVNGHPDWVRVPEKINHRLAGKKVQVSGTHRRTCICRGHEAIAWDLAESDLAVIKCSRTGNFYTFKKQERDE